MKKLLLSLATAVLCASAAMADADIIVKDWTAVNKDGSTYNLEDCTWTNGDFTFSVAKNGGSTAPAYNKGGDFRFYAKNTFTVTAVQPMTKITFTISTNGLKRLTTFDPSTGECTGYAEGATAITWTGNATSVTFTVGDKATYGTDGATKAGQFCFDALSIVGGGTFSNTTGGGGDTPVTPTEPNYFKATTVESGSAYVFVADGKYSVIFDRNYGYMSTSALPDGTTDSFEGAEDAAITIAAATGGYTMTTSGGKVLGAKAGYNTFDTTDDSADNRVWTISFNADGTATIVNVATGKTVAQDPQYGSFGCYDADALEGKNLPTLFKFDGAPVVPPTPEDITFTRVSSITAGSEYAFVVEVDGTYHVGTPASQSASYGRFSFADVTVTDNTIKTVAANAFTFEAQGTGYAIKDTYGRYMGFDGDHKTSFQFYDAQNEFTAWDVKFSNGTAVITMTVNGFTGQIGVTKGNEGTWYTNIAPSVDAADIICPALFVKGGSSSVEAITVADENAPVEYYNLQGVRVANPENGLYIRRQGSSVSKIYVR